MIYLIDDNSKGQRIEYGASYIDEGQYDDILIHIEKTNGSTDVSFLCNAKLIMIHDSLEDFENGGFVENSRHARHNIDDIAQNNNIPLVYFSDGHIVSEMDPEGNITQLKKADFYYRLKDFLENYKELGVLDLKILAYGKNWKNLRLKEVVKKFYNKISNKKDNEILFIRDVLPSSKISEPNYLSTIIEIYAQPNLGKSYNEILDYIEDEQITVGEFKQRIDKILTSINRYGKNTYTWK